MATTVGSLLISMGLDSAQFKSGMSEVEKKLKSAQRSFEKTGRKMQSVGKSLSIGLTAPLVAFGVQAGKAAIDAEEMDAAFGTVFGDMSNDVRKWAETTGDAMGRSTQEMQRGALAFQELFSKALQPEKAAAMSKEFAVLTRDLASFKNLSNDVAQQKLFSGLSGEAEPLWAVGVFLSEAKVQAAATALGLQKVNGKLTEEQKIIARSAVIKAELVKANGDVIRTQDSTANQIKKAKAAWEELSVTLGNKLLPAVTPLIEAAGRLLDRFSKLSPGMQTFIVGAAAAAAALGPLIFAIGTVVKFTAPMLSLIQVMGGLAIASGTAGGAIAAFSSGVVAFGVALAPVLVPIAAIAAAGALIYANWDKISPILDKLSAKFQEAVGPKIAALVDTVTEKFTTLWNGPLGDGIRGVMTLIGKFQAKYLEVFGEGLVRVISAAVDVISGAFDIIIQSGNLIVAFFSGDWAGAWQAMKNIASTALNTVINVIKSLAPNAIASIRGMVDGIYQQIVGRLGKVWDDAVKKVELVKSAFYNMYDAVVGHSYVPDMVDGIGHHMARLDGNMVQVTKNATKEVAEAFDELSLRVQGILDRLFPELRSLIDFKSESNALSEWAQKGLIDVDQLAEALRRLKVEYFDGLFGQGSNAISEQGSLFTSGDSQSISDKFGQIANDNADAAEAANVRIIDSFKNAAEKTISAVQTMSNAIKGGGFLDILSSVIGLGLQLGSIGAFGSKFAQSVNKPIPGFAGGTNFAPGGMALVGERGPELVNLPRGSQVVPNHKLNAGGMGITVTPSPYFDVVVDNRARQVAGPMSEQAAIAGSVSAQTQIARRENRRIG